MRHVKRTVVACVSAAFAASNSGAADYEAQFDKPAKDAVPPTVAAGPDFAARGRLRRSAFVLEPQHDRGFDQGILGHRV
jgi:hypothetical protein